MIEWRHAIDLSAVAIIPAAWLELLPHAATMLTVVWMAIRIYETDTVQRWLGRKKCEKPDREDKP